MNNKFIVGSTGMSKVSTLMSLHLALLGNAEILNLGEGYSPLFPQVPTPMIHESAGICTYA